MLVLMTINNSKDAKMLTTQQIQHKLIRGIKRESKYTEQLAHYYNCLSIILGKVLLTQYFTDNQINANSPEQIDFDLFALQLRTKYPDLTIEEITFLALAVPSKYINQKFFNTKSSDDFPNFISIGITDFNVLNELHVPFLAEAMKLLCGLSK